MSYPGSNVTFNLYDVNPPSYPIGLGKPSGAAGSGEDNVLRPRSPLSTANSLVLPPSSKSPSSGTTPLASDSTPTSSGAGLKKSQSLRVPNRTVAPLAIPTSSRDDTVRPASSAHPGSLNRSQTALSPLSASVSSNSGSQSAGGLLGSSNPFNDLSSSLQIPSFRPNLSRMGRKISEFGKEVFSLEEEPELPSRVRTPVGGGAAAAALGGERRAVSGAGSGVGGEGTKAPVPRPGAMAPPLIRSGTAPVPLAPSSGTILAAGTTSTNPPTLNRSSTSMVTSTSQPSRPVTRPASIPEDVPGMGDEPIMCPFCDKPLPPPLIISQLAHLHAVKERGKRASEATLVDKVDKGAEGAVKRADSVPAKPADIAPAPAAAAAKTKGDERATAESFLPVVKMSEAAEKAASAPEGLISADQIKEWSRRAGIKVDDSESTSKTTGSARLVAPDEVKTATAAQATPAPAPASEAFSLLPPPPPPASRVKSPAPANSAIAKSDLEDSSRSKVPDGGHGSRFGGLFGKKGAQSDGQDEEDDSGDDYAQGGYAKLSGPASPERVENRRLELGERKKSPVGSEKGDSAVTGGERGLGDGIGDKVESTGDAAVVKDEKAEGAPVGSDVQGNKTASGGDQDDLKAVLQEVLDKVNMMTKSHTELATSHNHLLTSLKIARSNLVMAEANAEMLEEQLRKAAIHQPAATHGSAIPPRKSSAAIQDGRRSLEETRRPAGPVQAVKAAPKPRPNSLVIPASALFETGPMTGPASSRPSMEAASKAGNNSHSSSGVFGGFFGGKTLSSLNIPTAKELQASAARLGDSLAGPSRPGTPINGGLMVAGPGGASGLGYAHAQSNAHLRADHSTSQPSSSTSPAQFFDYHMPSPPTSHHPSPNPDGTGRVVSGSGSGPGSGHGASPSNNSTPLARPALSPAHSGQFATEFAKLRNAYASSQTKMEAMARELTDLKKGKIEMEAELETLSQALFEEANKMVADERRKRLESEEMLKEVKEEKEVLKETIKVLGGKDKVPEVTVTAESADEVKEAKTAGKVEDDVDDEAWKPRDLDKHYEALRKTIHHVADGASPNTAVLGDGGAMLTDAVNYSGATREFEAALDEVQAAAEAEGVLGFTPVGVNPVLELSPVLPKETREAEVNPWAEVDFSGASASTAVPRKTSHGYGMDPLESRRESLGLNLRGVDFGEGLDGSAVIEPPTRRAAAEETPVQETGSIGMRRTSSA